MEPEKGMFWICANGLHEEGVDIWIVEQDVQILSVLLCALSYIRDGWYLRGYVTPELESGNNVCYTNVDFYQTSSPDGLAEFHYHRTFATRALRGKGVSEELYGDSGNIYTLFSK